MILQPCELWEEQVVGLDELGNEKTKLRKVSETKYWGVDWSLEEIKVLGRAYTESRRSIALAAPLEAVKRAQLVKLDGQLFNIEEVAEARRWRLATVKRYRV